MSWGSRKWVDMDGVCNHCCDSLALLALVKFFVASFCFFIAMLVHSAVNGQGIRRRFVAKQPASQQLAEPVAKRRRFSEKQPVPALLAFPSLPAVAVLPVDPNLWGRSESGRL